MSNERIIVPTALYGAEAWGIRSAERRKVNVPEMKCLRSLVGVSRMDRVRNEEVRRRAGIERELASTADQRVLRWLGHVERMEEYRMARRVLALSNERKSERPYWPCPTVILRLDGWCEGILGQQRNYGGGCATMREGSESVGRPGTYVTDGVSRGQF